MNIILTIMIVLLLSILFTYTFKKLKIASVIGLLLVGFILDIPVVRVVVIDPNIEMLYLFGDIALITLMFLAGLETSWKNLYSERKDAFIMATLGSIVPITLGTIIFLFLGFDLLPALITSVCMSITAEATKARVLIELNKIKSKVGSAMMGAGIIDDVIGLSLFVLITYILKKAYIREDLLIGAAILAFFIGVFVQNNVGRHHHLLQKIEFTIIWFFVPFFFVSVALHMNMLTMSFDILLLIIVVTIALIGKMSGILLTKPFTNFKWKQLYLIGWAMNSRGAVEMALALIAFRSNLISVELYSSLIIMAMITTVLFPLIMTHIVKKDPGIMD